MRIAEATPCPCSGLPVLGKSAALLLVLATDGVMSARVCRMGYGWHAQLRTVADVSGSRHVGGAR